MRSKPRYSFCKLGHIALDFCGEAFVAFHLRHFDEFEQIARTLHEFIKRRDSRAQSGQTAHDILRFSRVFPQIRRV